MRIIIAGDGEVGYYLAKLLILEFNDITLIDTQKDKLDYAEKSLGIATILGDSTSYVTLQEANINQTDLLIAVTSVESANITTCIIGKKLGAKLTIARISNLEYLEEERKHNFRMLGIDILISPESLASREVKYALQTPSLIEIFNLHEKSLYVMGILVEKEAAILGKRIIETRHLIPDNSFMILAILRQGNTIIPTGDTIFQEKDIIYFVSTENGKERVIDYAGKRPIRLKKILIIGASKTGQILSGKLASTYQVKVIDTNLEKCNQLAKRNPLVDVVFGDGTSTKILEEEKVEQFDAIISATGNSETNIVSCLLAKEYGIQKTIAMVENIGLFDFSQKVGIDTLINKKLAAANFIFRSISKIQVLAHLYGVDAKIHEFVIEQDSRLKGILIKNLKLPDGIIISGAIRANKGLITLGNFTFEEGDKVFVFSTNKNSSVVHSFFK